MGDEGELVEDGDQDDFGTSELDEPSSTHDHNLTDQPVEPKPSSGLSGLLSDWWSVVTTAVIIHFNKISYVYLFLIAIG